MAEGGAVDEAFIGAGKNVGLEIWRIEVKFYSCVN